MRQALANFYHAPLLPHLASTISTRGSLLPTAMASPSGEPVNLQQAYARRCLYHPNACSMLSPTIPQRKIIPSTSHIESWRQSKDRRSLARMWRSNLATPPSFWLLVGYRYREVQRSRSQSFCVFVSHTTPIKPPCTTTSSYFARASRHHIAFKYFTIPCRSWTAVHFV